MATGVYVLSGEGQVFCLGPRTGKIYWSLNLAELEKTELQMMSSPTVQVIPGDKGQVRRIYFGMTAVGATSKSPLAACLEDELKPGEE